MIVNNKKMLVTDRLQMADELYNQYLQTNLPVNEDIISAYIDVYAKAGKLNYTLILLDKMIVTHPHIDRNHHKFN